MQPYTARDVIRLLRSPAGRSDLAVGAWRIGWPVLRPLAAAYRRTALRRTRVAVVVGSFGKTTTTRTVRTVLGVRLDAPVFHNCLSHVAGGLLRQRPSVPYAALEVGITQAGQMAVYARMIRPDITVVTSIGGEHRTSLGTPEATRAEKSRMVAALPRDGWAILNGDDPHVMWMRTCTRANVMTYGRGEGCDVRAVGVALDWPHGMRIEVRTPVGDAQIGSRLLGDHMVYPVLAAVAAGLSQGIPLAEVVRRVWRVPAPSLRMELVALPGAAWLLRDEYKSAEETIHAALDTLARIPAARKWVVLGAITEPPLPARPAYRAIGARLAAVADGVAFLGSGWRDYAAGARRAGMPSDRMARARGVTDAAAWAQARVRPGDIVLVKGRNRDRMERVSLALMGGRTVRCNLAECGLRIVACDGCPMLARTFTQRTCPPRCRLELPV